MRLALGLAFLAWTSVARAGDTPQPADPCLKVDGWRAALCDFSHKNLVHPAWGYEHSLRDYTLAMQLAAIEAVPVDEEVMFAAAMLHDMGGFAPYAQTGVDHAVRSTQVCDQVLKPAGFPMAKAAAVHAAILNHSYYDHTKPATAEGIALHDADGLDFLGGVAAMRILATVGQPDVAPDTASALGLLRTLNDQVPLTMYGGDPTKRLLKQRQFELAGFLDTVARESYGFGVPRKD